MTALCSVLITLVVGLSPFWLGSNRPLPWAGNAMAIGSVVAITAIAVLVEGRRYPAIKIGVILFPLLLIATGLSWALVQTLPLGSLLPAHPAWAVAGEALGRELTGMISVNPSQTRWALLHWATAAAVLTGSYFLARRDSNANILLNGMLLMMALAAVYGLARLSFSFDKILWFDERAGSYLTAGFINRNSAATYFGMGTVAALGLLLHKARRIVTRSREASGRDIAHLWTGGISGSLGFSLVVFVVLFVALLATGSRGGIGFTVVALLVLILLYSLRQDARRERSLTGPGWVLIVFASVVLITGILEMSGARVLGRLMEQGLASTARLDTYQRTLAAIGDYAWIGSGLGTFQDVFPAYRLEIAAGRQVWDKAHNDYLELILGLGIPASMLVLAGLSGLVWKAISGFFNRRRNAHFAAIAVASAVLVALHSLVDFSLQMQANALAFALFTGLGLGQSVSSRS